ncbi:cyanophycin synthetase [Ferroacidibacillus organovorans]|uniref:Cyanophycin synthetase n=1 Tax=Ferroacidibacillus organovorans TaxID=1765683 RepID=A0A101XSA5_9BACL|nr:cyanophycin synthetase [Ferroacidibacillus organovorans]KUO96598.1 cyanophycin synthetase [Ferroacidibacillus organovorans]
MKVIHYRHLDGPNLYLHRPVLVVRVDLEEFTERESYEYHGFVERLLTALPGLYDHYCATGRPGGFVERLYGGTYFGHIIEHVAIEMLTRLGYTSNFGKTRNALFPGIYDIIIECKNETVVRRVLQVAMEYVEACAKQYAYPLEGQMSQLHKLVAHSELGPSTAAIAQAAARRQIPVRRIGAGSLLQLGYGKFRRYVQATMTQLTSAIGVDIASDKALTKQILDECGIRIPLGVVTDSVAEALHFLQTHNVPIALKPLHGNQGRGVTVGIRLPHEVEAAFAFAQTISREVVVEEYVRGRQYRLLVVDQRLVAAAERVPAHVVGDGVHAIQELIDRVNQQPERGEDHEKPLTRIVVDQAVMRHLEREKRTLRDIPRYGERVWLRDSANLSTGGIAIDVSRDVDPFFERLALRAARAVALDVCGVDLIAEDIAQKGESQSYAVIEVNAAPGIRMHHHPSVGESRDVAAAIVDQMYPRGMPSRIPIVSVTGTNGKTTTTRLIRHILRESGLTVGMTSTEGVYIDEECVLAGDTTGPQSARVVLSDARVEAAVLETARGGIQRAGLGYDMADVGIITSLADDHIGQDGITSVEDILKIKSLIVECLTTTGLAVLNADVPALVDLSERLRHPVAFVSRHADNPVIVRHLARGGMAFFVREGWLVEAAGSLEWNVARIEDISITIGGAAAFHIINCLCAIAAARHLGMTRRVCADALHTFRSDRHNPGRSNVFRLRNGQYVICDYGHNTEGVRAIGEMAMRLSGRRVPCVIGFPGDRDNRILEAAAQAAADYFSPIFVKEDSDKRGRREGELANLIAAALARTGRAENVTIELDEVKALREMIRTQPDEPLLIMFHEKLEPVRNALIEQGAIEVSELKLAAQPSISAM